MITTKQTRKILNISQQTGINPLDLINTYSHQERKFYLREKNTDHQTTIIPKRCGEKAIKTMENYAIRKLNYNPNIEYNPRQQ